MTTGPENVYRYIQSLGSTSKETAAHSNNKMGSLFFSLSCYIMANIQENNTQMAVLVSG